MSENIHEKNFKKDIFHKNSCLPTRCTSGRWKMWLGNIWHLYTLSFVRASHIMDHIIYLSSYRMSQQGIKTSSFTHFSWLKTSITLSTNRKKNPVFFSKSNRSNKTQKKRKFNIFCKIFHSSDEQQQLPTTRTKTRFPKNIICKVIFHFRTSFIFFLPL